MSLSASLTHTHFTPSTTCGTTMRAGTSAYRSERYDEALKTWTGLPGADAAYNRGNALARLGRFDDAIASFDQAISIRPGHADASMGKTSIDTEGDGTTSLHRGARPVGRKGLCNVKSP